MRLHYLIPSLILGVFVLTGCEGSKFPLSDPADSVVDERIVGSWKFVGDDSDKASYVNIFAFNDREYYVETWEDGDEDELLRLNVFSTDIDGIFFANMSCINCDEDDDEPYIFVRYELVSDDELMVELIDDDEYDEIQELESIDAVNYYVRKRMRENTFYDDEAGIYQRMDEEPVRGD